VITDDVIAVILFVAVVLFVMDQWFNSDRHQYRR
jgi:hypothetical protein